MSLTTFIVIGGLLLILVLLPRVGLVARIRAAVEVRRRRREEDALKHIIDRRNEGIVTTGAALSGLMRISPGARMRLQSRLEAKGLIHTEGEKLELTINGEELALHILRAHRLWEHYLANEAHLPLGKVHKAAHRLEHRLDAAAVENMEAMMGYPDADPHGDPIPARDGTLPADRAATPLTSWPQGKQGVVVHLEDEPDVAFRQILAEGLSLGQTLRIISATPDRVTLTDGERELRLAPVVAANVFVSDRIASATLQGDGLDSLRVGEEAEVIGIADACQGFTRRRLLDLGLIPGTRIVPELANSFGDPRAYRIRGTLVALRREQASQVLVQSVSGTRQDSNDTQPALAGAAESEE